MKKRNGAGSYYRNFIMENITQIYSDIKTQADAVLYFIQHLDIDMVDLLLSDQYTYQDFEKCIFINKLGIAFDKFIQEGDTYLYRHCGYCNSHPSRNRCKGFTFIGNNSRYYMDLIIVINDGVVQDIYDCRNFKIINGVPNRRGRIEVDPDAIPF